MSDYTPDRWLVLAIDTPNEKIYKVFATWSGGYGGSDSWKLNSGVVQAQLVDSYWEFTGSSGSIYRCHKDAYGTNGYGGAVLSNLVSKAQSQNIKIQVLSQEMDWGRIQYEPLAQWVEKGVDND